MRIALNYSKIYVFTIMLYNFTKVVFSWTDMEFELYYFPSQ